MAAFMNGAWGCGYHEFFEAADIFEISHAPIEVLQVVVPDGKVHMALEKARQVVVVAEESNLEVLDGRLDVVALESILPILV